jgi:hypothetical protein
VKPNADGQRPPERTTSGSAHRLPAEFDSDQT